MPLIVQEAGKAFKSNVLFMSPAQGADRDWKLSLAEISLTGFLGGSSGLLDGADGGGGHGRRDAFKLLRCLLQVSFRKWCIPRAAATGGCVLHESRRNPSDQMCPGSSGCVLSAGFGGSFPLKHEIIKRQNHSFTL